MLFVALIRSTLCVLFCLHERRGENESNRMGVFFNHCFLEFTPTRIVTQATLAIPEPLLYVVVLFLWWSPQRASANGV